MSASSTALQVKASDSPARNAVAAIVILLWQPTRRPAGLVKAHQSSASPWSNGRAIPAATLSTVPIWQYFDHHRTKDQFSALNRALGFPSLPGQASQSDPGTWPSEFPNNGPVPG
jgi:hypothetical protein